MAKRSPFLVPQIKKLAEKRVKEVLKERTSLVDDLQALRLEIAALKEKETALEERIKAKLREGETKRVVRGNEYRALIRSVETARFSGTKAKEFLTPMQIKKCTTLSSYLKIIIAPKSEDLESVAD